MEQNQKPIKFIVGQQYEDNDGNIWKCICTDRKADNNNILISVVDSTIIEVDDNGDGRDIECYFNVKITKHIVPKKEVWINFYEDSIGNAFETKEEADNYACIKRKECICFIEK